MVKVLIQLNMEPFNVGYEELTEENAKAMHNEILTTLNANMKGHVYCGQIVQSAKVVVKEVE